MTIFIKLSSLEFHSAHEFWQIFFLNGLSFQILLVMCLSVFLFWRLIIGLEQVNAID